jgi:hypothetical protein
MMPRIPATKRSMRMIWDVQKKPMHGAGPVSSVSSVEDVSGKSLEVGFGVVVELWSVVAVAEVLAVD